MTTNPTAEPTQCQYWISPVSHEDAAPAFDVIQKMLRNKPPYFCWGKNTPGKVWPGDRICVYATGKSDGPGRVVADAVALTSARSAADRRLIRKLKPDLKRELSPLETKLEALIDDLDGDGHVGRYPMVFLLDESTVDIYPARRWRPVPYDQLSAFGAENHGRFIGVTRRVDAHDFRLLTGKDV